jgi:hypothetical protein
MPPVVAFIQKGKVIVEEHRKLRLQLIYYGIVYTLDSIRATYV